MVNSSNLHCLVCRDLERNAMPDFKQRMIQRDGLFASVSNKNACHSCSLIWMSLSAFHDWNKVVAVLLDFDIVPGTLTIWPMNLDNLGPDENIRLVDKVVLYSHGGEHPKWLDIIGVAPGSSRPSGDAENFAKAKIWMEECMANHLNCQTPLINYVPTRLIDVGNEHTNPKLHITNGTPVQQGYLTLSHCWGQPDANTKKLELTQHTLTAFQEGIPLDDLSKTFHDAVLTTRKLGYHFIWIDSLCIIQHDQGDWAQEASQMYSVYQNSLLTIAADQAPHSNHGFLSNPIDMGKAVHFLQFTNPDGQTDTIFARNAYFTPALDALACYNDEQKSSLDERAWTFQEWLLSPRILHFGEFELVWECNECVVCKCERKTKDVHYKKKFVDFVKAMATTINSSDDSSSSNALNLSNHTSLWTSLTQQFSARNITFATDRLPAIGGLADAMNRFYPDEYLAGHWKTGLNRTLLWQAGNPSSRHESYYAPSWSWASTTGPVSFFGQSATLLWSVQDAKCTRTGRNPFGQVSDGYVCVCGPVTKVSVLREPFFNKRKNKEQVRYLAVSQGVHPSTEKLVERVSLDVGLDGGELSGSQRVLVSPPSSQQVKEEYEDGADIAGADANASDGDGRNSNDNFHLLFAAYEGSPGGWGMGLLLKRSTDKTRGADEVYKRVGIVICERQQWKNWEAVTTVETVTII